MVPHPRKRTRAITRLCYGGRRFSKGVARKRVCRKLVDYSDRYRNEGDVQPLLNDILKPLNEGRANPQATLTVAEYATLHFFPHVEAECKPSTVNGYKALWRMYLKAGLENIALRDFRCVHATTLLAEISRRHGIGRKTLRHCKGLLSSIFTYAKQQGVIDGLNPVKDAGIPRSAPKSKPTVAATPEDVIAMLSVLDGVAKLAVALMYFTGMRPGEARGARW